MRVDCVMILVEHARMENAKEAFVLREEWRYDLIHNYSLLLINIEDCESPDRNCLLFCKLDGGILIIYSSYSFFIV